MKTTTQCIDRQQENEPLHEYQSAMDDAWTSDPLRLDETYRRRSLELARRCTPSAPNAATRPMLVVALGAERYGIDLTSVTEVLPYTKCTPVAGAPPELLGVFNFHQEIRSIVRLSSLLALPESSDGVTGYIVLVRTVSFEVGLQVDRVDRIELVATESLFVPGSGGGTTAVRFVRGMTPDRLAVLNVAELLSHPVFQIDSSDRKGTEHDW